jgi:hypothetical protein
LLSTPSKYAFSCEEGKQPMAHVVAVLEPHWETASPRATTARDAKYATRNISVTEKV